MTTNMGTIDRVVRITLGLAVALLYFGGFIGGTAAVLLGMVAAAFIVTSTIGWCPLYLPFGLSTVGKKSGANTRAR